MLTGTLASVIPGLSCGMICYAVNVTAHLSSMAVRFPSPLANEPGLIFGGILADPPGITITS